MNNTEYSLLKTAYYNSGISNTEKTANVLARTLGGGAIGAVTGGLAGRGIEDGTGGMFREPGNYSGTGALIGGIAGALGGRHHGKIVKNLGKTQKTLGRTQDELVTAKDNYKTMSGMFDDATAANKSLRSDLKRTQGALDESSKSYIDMLAQRNQVQENLARQADKYTEMAQRVGRRDATISGLNQQISNLKNQNQVRSGNEALMSLS